MRHLINITLLALILIAVMTSCTVNKITVDLTAGTGHTILINYKYSAKYSARGSEDQEFYDESLNQRYATDSTRIYTPKK